MVLVFRLRLYQPRDAPFCFRFCDFCSRGSQAVSLKGTFLCVFKIVQLLSGFWFHTKIFFVQFTAWFVCLPGLVSGGLLVFCLGPCLTLGVPFRPPLG